MIDFGIDFLTILVPSWVPSWGNVGHVFDQMGRFFGKSAPFLLRWNFRFDILRRGPMGYSIFGAVGRWGTPFLAPGGDGVPRFWLHFCAKLALFWATWGGFVGLRKA